MEPVLDPAKEPLRSREDLSDYAPGRHEGLLRSDPTRYAELVRNVSAYGIYMVDKQGRIQSWNRGAANITGYAERDVIGKPYDMVFAESGVREAQPLKTMTYARTNGHCREDQNRRKRSGEEFVAHITLDAVRGPGGEIIAYVEVFNDITEQKRREEQLYLRATRDPLTGLYSRGHFTELATIEIDRARRFAEPLSVAILDIDHFKKVNDTYGHEAGDKTIICLANTCARFIRKIDILGRIGGEEFALVLPRANKEPAVEILQRLRIKLAEQRVPVLDKDINFTVSIGIATLRPTTRDLAELLRNADASLYKAKREGRNRVEAWFE
jgi:diguanylate cyclase (GGDEF)-like protein/PAS domain S-box-containing protein